MMTKIYVNINGVETEAKGELLQSILDFQAQAELDRQAQEAEREAKAIAKAALLERLGLTEAEAALLIS
jgi:type II secretory pathway component PulK